MNSRSWWRSIGASLCVVLAACGSGVIGDEPFPSEPLQGGGEADARPRVEPGASSGSVETSSFQLVPNAIMGTLGHQPDAIYETWNVAAGTWIGGWNLGGADRIVRNQVADFDADGYDDVIVRSAWGLGVLGTNTSNAWTSKAMNAWGASIGTPGHAWTLNAQDQVVAVGYFANRSPAGAAMMVLQNRTNGIAFVKISGGVLSAVRVVPNGGLINAGGATSWTVGPDDRIVNAGKLQGGSDDALVVLSSAGMAAYLPSMTGAPTLIARQANGTAWTGTVTYTLQADDLRLRAYGADIDMATGARSELVLTGPSGLAVFQINTSAALAGPARWDLRFRLPDGHVFPGTAVKGTLHNLVKLTNFNAAGGADFMFQTETGIALIGPNNVSTVPWTFTQLAARSYGSVITWWNSGANDIVAPNVVADVANIGKPQFLLTSVWGLGLGYHTGSDFGVHGTTPFSSLSLTDGEQVVGAGKFDRSNRYTLVYKKVALTAPTRAAVLTYNVDNNRTGVQPQETLLTPNAVANLGLVPAYSDITADGSILAQVLVVPDVSVQGAAVKDLAIIATGNNTIKIFNAADGVTVSSTTFVDPENSTLRPVKLGIKGTPVVDYDRKILYFVFGTWDGGSNGAYWLTAYDLQAQTTLRTMKIVGSYPKTNGDPETFKADIHFQRPGLLLQKGSIYVAFGAMGNREFSTPYHGWVFRFDAESFECRGVFNSSPNETAFGSGGGIWQGGGAVTADGAGNIYVMTGNGTDSNHPGVVPGSYGDSMIRLSARGSSLQFRGRFGTDDSAKTLQVNDWDFGGAGALALPGTNAILGGGKEGKFFIANSGAMENPNSATVQSFQAFESAFDLSWKHHTNWYGSPHVHGQPIFWNNFVYHQAELDVVKAFAYNTGPMTLTTTPVRSSDGRTSPMGNYMAGRQALSANGNDFASGVLWVRHQTRDDNATGCEGPDNVHRTHGSRLTAYSADARVGELTCLQSYQLTHIHHGVPPTVANGKVFVPAMGPSGEFVVVYKLGTGAGFPDCFPDYQATPLCMGLVFKTADARAVTSTGDWAPGYVKSECPAGQGARGLSREPATSATRALYCGRAFHSKFYPGSACRTVNFQSTTSGECNAGEYVAGVAQVNGAPTHLLCCTGTSLTKTSCVTTTLSSSSNVSDPAGSVDFNTEKWDPPNSLDSPPRPNGMAQCGPTKYMVGVSRSSSPFSPTAIRCCNL